MNPLISLFLYTSLSFDTKKTTFKIRTTQSSLAFDTNNSQIHKYIHPPFVQCKHTTLFAIELTHKTYRFNNYLPYKIHPIIECYDIDIIF